MSESCCNRNTSIIETFKLSQCKKSSLYICASWNLKHQRLHFNLPNSMFLTVMTSKNYPVNLSNVNFTESGHHNSIKFLQVNSLCRKILHQIDITLSRNCTQLRNSFGVSATASLLQMRSSATQACMSEPKDLSDGSTLFLMQSHTEATATIIRKKTQMQNLQILQSVAIRKENFKFLQQRKRPSTFCLPTGLQEQMGFLHDTHTTISHRSAVLPQLGVRDLGL